MAANITVAAGIVAQDYQGTDPSPRLRIFVTHSFVAADTETVLRSTFEEGEFYDQHECFIDGDGQVNYPSFLIHSTVDALSNPDNAKYTFALFTSTGDLIQVIAKRIIVPATPTTTSLPVLDALSGGPAPPPPSPTGNYYTKAEINALLAALTFIAATQAEAVGGTNNTHFMTPLRVAQELAALVPTFTFATQAQAEAGTSTSVVMSPLRVAQEIAALVSNFTFATQAQAEAGTATSVMMSPLRTAQAITTYILDTVYGSGWNGDTTHTASRNAIYDKIEAVIAYADGLVTGLLDDRGNYDASGNLFPATGGSGAAGAVKKGDLWTISVGGTIGGSVVEVGDVVRALVDTPGQTAGNWAITEHNFSYVPENQANKSSNIAGDTGSTTKYPNVAAVEVHVLSRILDTAYGAGWNGDTDHAPSRNAVYDKIETVLAGGLVDDTAYDPTTWNGVTTVAPSKNAVRDRLEFMKTEVLEYALSDESTALTTGLKLTTRVPYDFTVTNVRTSLTTVSSSGLVTVDVKESGTSIFSTLPSIDATELTSTTAATPEVISDTSLADDNELTFHITAAGTGAKGLKVRIYGYKA